MKYHSTGPTKKRQSNSPSRLSSSSAGFNGVRSTSGSGREALLDEFTSKFTRIKKENIDLTKHNATLWKSITTYKKELIEIQKEIMFVNQNEEELERKIHTLQKKLLNEQEQTKKLEKELFLRRKLKKQRMREVDMLSQDLYTYTHALKQATNDHVIIERNVKEISDKLLASDRDRRKFRKQYLKSEKSCRKSERRLQNLQDELYELESTLRQTFT